MATERQRDRDPDDDIKTTISAGGKVVETTLGGIKAASKAMEAELKARSTTLRIPDTLKREAETDELKVNLCGKGLLDVDVIFRARNGDELRVRGQCLTRQLHSKPKDDGRTHRLLIDLELALEVDAISHLGEVVDRYTYGELQPEPSPAKTAPLNFTAH